MTDRSGRGVLVMRVGVALALLTLLYGFGLGGVFGAVEDKLKGRLDYDGATYLASLDPGERAAQESKVEATVKRAWTYLKRAHLHANGLGTASLAVILLLSTLDAGDRPRRLIAAAMGLGSLGYSLFWMLAGLRAPGMGSTGAAKESLQWLAVPTSGLCLLGLVGAIVLFARAALARREASV